MKLDSDKVVGLSAVVIGLCSLFIVVYQTMLTRETAHASVMPYLMIAMMANSENGVFLMVNNTGIGPALIEDVRVRKPDGEYVAGDAYDFVTSTLPADVGPLDVDRLLTGRLVPAGATMMTVGTNGEDREFVYKEFLRLFDIAEVPDSWYTGIGFDASEARAVLEIDYASVYGERWRIRSDSTVPEEL